MEETKEKQEVAEVELRGGEVVWVDGWCVIGIVEKYDEPNKTLYLVWPEKGYWLSGESQPFSPVGRGGIHVLSPREVLERMFEVIQERDAKMAKEVARTLEVKGRASIFGNS